MKDKLPKLSKFNDLEFNCDECCLKKNKECRGDKEYCAIKYDKIHEVQRKLAADQPIELCGQGRCMECPRTLC